MWCNKCDIALGYDCAMGYGDYMCDQCGTTYYGDTEYDEDGNEIVEEDL